MTIDEALVAFFASQSGVTALIGTRLYPMVAPQNPTYPHAIYQRISSVRTGSLAGDSGLVDPRFQISAKAQSYAAARNTCIALRDAISGYQGLMGALPVSASVAESENDLYYDDIGVFQSSFDVFLTHQE